MDGFDDLLSSSSRALEDNPFANPFDKPRSGSPDPWSTFGQQQHNHETYASHFGEGFGTTSDLVKAGSVSLGTYTEESPYGAKKRVNGPEARGAEPVTPEETDLDFQDPGLQSPGFRESIPADDAAKQDTTGSPPLSRHPPVVGEIQSTSSVSSRSMTPTPSLPSPVAEEQTRISDQFLPPSPPSQSSQVVSPLDYPNHGSSQVFASLALGGESTGGWHDAQTEYASLLPETLEGIRQGESEAMKSEADSVEEEENPSTNKSDPEFQSLFSISVEDPQKVGDPIRPYILYTVHTKTTSPLFSKPSFSVLRRYSDFLWLYETLSLNNPGVIVPPVPEKSSFGRFANLFVQQRRLALEICIQKIANHPILAKDPDLKVFLESDSFALDIKHRKTEIAQERGGIMSSIGQTISGPKFFEVDDWFDRKKAYLDGLESQLKGLVKSIDSVSKQREDLAIATGEFALSIGELSESDLSKQLCHSLAVLSDVEKKAQDLQHTQAQEDTITFMTTAEEYARIINSVRVAFASRVRCHAQWQSAESELRRVKQAHEKARGQGRIPQERMGHSLAQIADAERRALDAKHDFDRCSKLVKVELVRFEEERISDFKIALEAFLEGMIQRQKEMIMTWESYQELLLKKANAKHLMTSSQGQAGAV